MSEQQTPVVEQAAAPQSPSTPPKKEKTPATHEQKQKKRKLIRRIIALVVALAIIITSAVLLKKFVFNDKEELGEVMTMPVTLGSIQSMVEVTGNARAKNSAGALRQGGRHGGGGTAPLQPGRLRRPGGGLHRPEQRPQGPGDGGRLQHRAVQALRQRGRPDHQGPP